MEGQGILHEATTTLRGDPEGEGSSGGVDTATMSIESMTSQGICLPSSSTTDGEGVEHLHLLDYIRP